MHDDLVDAEADVVEGDADIEALDYFVLAMVCNRV